jgi:tRNA 2-thiouridine synthesizing protein E
LLFRQLGKGDIGRIIFFYVLFLAFFCDNIASGEFLSQLNSLYQKKEEKMPIMNFGGKSFQIEMLEGKAFLASADDWCPEWVQFVKAEEGITELTGKHYAVLFFLGCYYAEHKIAPLVLNVCQAVGLTIAQIYKLFPSGPCKGAGRMAGLPDIAYTWSDKYPGRSCHELQFLLYNQKLPPPAGSICLGDE